MISIHIDWSSRDRPQQTHKHQDTYNYKMWKRERQESQQRGQVRLTVACDVQISQFLPLAMFFIRALCCTVCFLLFAKKITSAALISLIYWHSDIQGAKRLLPWVVTYWRHCCPLNLRPLLLRNFGPKNNVIAKDFLLTGREQACTRIDRLFVWFVAWLSPHA